VSRPATIIFEVWEITSQLRWVPTDNTNSTRFVLEQAWRNPDGRLEWRAVPKVLYGVAPDPGR
jgi:hypothetical protein